MVPDLVARLARMDQRFDGLDARLDRVNGRLEGIDARLDHASRRLNGIDTRLDGVDRRLEGIDARLGGIDRRFDNVDARFDTVDRRFDELSAEIQRHFGVVAESLASQIQLVAEGVLTIDRKVDRVADELRGELVRLNRRMLTLSARIPPKRRR